MNMLTLLSELHHSFIVSRGCQNKIWKLAAPMTGRPEVADLIDIWEDASIKAFYCLLALCLYS